MHRMGRRTDLECRYELRQRNQKEVEVEEEFELLVEHERKECEYVVFLVANHVRRELAL